MNKNKKEITRRRLLKLAFGGAAAAAALGGYAWRIEPHWVETVARDMPIPGLPAPLRGRTLVLINDLHIGPIVDEEYIASALQRVSLLQADILVIAGDLVNDGTKSTFDQAGRVIRHLRPGRLGTICILGNHDYGYRWSEIAAADRVAALYDDLGFHILRDAVCDLEGLRIVGIEDYWSPRFNMHNARAAVAQARSKPAVVLCHNPDAADEPIWSGFEGWILSGHTHGGQCKAPFFDPPFLPVRNKNYVAGVVDLGLKRKLYINRGLGYLRRVRFNMRPEITVFTMTRA